MTEPGEPDVGPGVDEAVAATRRADDPGGLQVDLEHPDTPDDDPADGLAEGIHETDKSR